LLGLALTVGLGAVASACTVDSGVVVTRTGFLTVQWSIAGTFSPAACAAFDVDVVDILVYDAGGHLIGRQSPVCEAHSATFELYPGTYAADVTMLAPGGAARTTTLQLPLTDVFSDQDVTLDTDFPQSSFY
jgi:hypothetical protein